MLTFNQTKTLMEAEHRQLAHSLIPQTRKQSASLYERDSLTEPRVRCTRAGQWGKPTFHVVSSRFDETNDDNSFMKGRNHEHRDSTVYYSEPQFLYAVGWQANGRH